MKWTSLARRYLIQDAPWLSLRKDRVRINKHLILDNYYVLEYCDWCHVLALTSDLKAILVKQYRHAYGELSLELPGGMVDEQAENRQEAALQAVKRELLEETGYAAETFIHLASLSPNPATHTNRVHGFLALDSQHLTEQRLEASEDIEIVMMPLDELIHRVQEGEIIQSMHVATILLAQHYLKHQSTK